MILGVPLMANVLLSEGLGWVEVELLGGEEDKGVLMAI